MWAATLYLPMAYAAVLSTNVTKVLKSTAIEDVIDESRMINVESDASLSEPEPHLAVVRDATNDDSQKLSLSWSFAESLHHVGGPREGGGLKLPAELLAFLGCAGAFVLVGLVLHYRHQWTLTDLETTASESKTRSGSMHKRSSLELQVGDLSVDAEFQMDEDGNPIHQSLVEKPEEAKMSTRSASMGLITVMVGAGVLALPNAVAAVGWVFAPFLIIGGGLVNCRVSHNLVNTIERVAAVRPGGAEQFKDVAEWTFGKLGGKIADGIFIAFLGSMIAVYIVLIGGNLHFLGTAVNFSWAKRPWILVTGILVSCTSLIKDVSALAKLGFIGVIASLMYVPCIAGGAIYAATTYHVDHRPMETFPPPSSSLGKMVSKFCVLLFGFCCSDSLTSFRANMVDPKQIGTAINNAHGITMIVYLIAGLLGYYGWGSAVQGNVLDSMCTQAKNASPTDLRMCPGVGEPPKPTAEAGTQMEVGYVLAGCVIANLFVSLPFSCFVLFKSVEGKFDLLRSNLCANYVMRLSTVAFLTLLGILIPFFMEMLSIISAVLIVAIVIILPTAFSMKMDYDDAGKSFAAIKLEHICMMGLGIVAMVIGLIDAVQEMKEAVAANPNGMNPFHNFWGKPEDPSGSG